MSKTVCIIQSNYIPWRGYFDLIGLSDEFIVYDNVQYTKNDWRNRNRIKTNRGSIWLTIPVAHSGHMGQAIDEARIARPAWAEKHWKTLSQAYGRASFFKHYTAELEGLYARSGEMDRLSQVNRLWIDFIVQALGISTPITSAHGYRFAGDRNARLIELCLAAGARRYLSGPAAQSYLDVNAFAENGIEVTFMDYDGYPDYPQLHGDFDPFVSILDLILNLGPDAPRFMKFAKRGDSSISLFPRIT